ncbi:MAG: hypothetical protein VYC39_17405 [Myxococcota bacterium]|nr:hypothetical protein [Myxococcota bacterium]
MLVAPIIALVATTVTGDLEWPSTRRVVLPASARTAATADAYVGEGIVDLRVRRPAPGMTKALDGQLGRIIERYDVNQDDVDLFSARLYTRIKYPAVKVLPIRRNRLILDVTVNPEALTPTNAITPPVFILSMNENGFPLPTRQYRASSPEGQQVLRAIDNGYVDEARIKAVNQPPKFLVEVLAEIFARHAVEGRKLNPSVNIKDALPESTHGKLMWTVFAVSIGMYAEADEVLRSLRKQKIRSINPYIDLYQAEIERRLGRKEVTVAQMRKIVRAGQDLPNHFGEKASLIGARLALQKQDLNEAISMVSLVNTPSLRMWRAELNYIAGRKGESVKLYRSLLNEASYALWAKLRLVDLNYYSSKEEAEKILFELNDRAENKTVSMLARARLLERGVLTKNFANTLSSLAHLSASRNKPVAMDAEMRLGRLNARAGRPKSSFQAFLRAENHAQDSMSRARIRKRTFAGMTDTVEQLVRWNKESQLVTFANDFGELLPQHPDAPDLMLKIARAARHEGNTSMAVEFLVKIAKRDDSKKNDEVLSELISTYLQVGDIARARTIIAYSDESRRTDKSATLNRAKAEVLNRAGDHKGAVKLFIRAAQLGKTVSERGDDLSRAADIALEHDMFGTAKQALTRMLYKEKLSTTRKTNVQIDLATVYIKEGKPKSAVDLLSRVRTSSIANRTPDALVAQASYFEGEALFRMGKYNEARTLWLSRARGKTHWDEFCRSAAQAADVAAKLEEGIQ